MLKIDYSQELGIFRYLLFPQGKIADRLLTSDVKKPANYPEILLFCRIAATSLSLWRLLPKGDKPVGNQPADIASIASLTRNVIETFNSFFFLCLDNAPEEERKFRRLTTALHYLVEKKLVGESLINSPNVDENLMSCELEVEALRRKIEQNSFFKQLDAKRQKSVLTGTRAMYLTRTQIAGKLKLDARFLEGQYKVLSNHTHPFAYGLYLEFSDDIGSDSDYARNRLALGLYLLNFYLGMSLHTMNAIYPNLNEFVTEEVNACAIKLANRFSMADSTLFR